MRPGILQLQQFNTLKMTKWWAFIDEWRISVIKLTSTSLILSTAYACVDTKPVRSPSSSDKSPVATVIRHRPCSKPVDRRSNTASALKSSDLTRMAARSGIHPVNACKSIFCGREQILNIKWTWIDWCQMFGCSKSVIDVLNPQGIFYTNICLYLKILPRASAESSAVE